MSQDNHITLRGYLTSEPKFRQTALTGTPVTEIRLGSTPRRLNRETGEWQDQPTSYYRVKCWRRLAVNASSSLHKGDMVVVRGRFYLRTWMDNQQRQRETVEIEADSLGHDLSYGWSHFLRGSRPSPGTQTSANTGELARLDLDPSDRDEADDEFPPAGDLEESADATFALGDPAHPADPADPAHPAHPAHPEAEAAEDGDPGAAAALVLSGAKGDVLVSSAESAPF